MAEASARARKCPICGKPPAERYKPFCSRRCADVDLHRWLSGGYAIPGADDPDDGEPPVSTGDAPRPPKPSV